MAQASTYVGFCVLVLLSKTVCGLKRFSLRASNFSNDERLNFVFVTDCSAHQRWMAFNVFSSAGHVGQTQPITWVRSGCEKQPEGDIEKAKAMYAHAQIVEVGGKDAKDFNLGFGVPKAVQSYLEIQGSDATQKVSLIQGLSASETWDDNTILALIEADMIFLTKFSLDNLDVRGMPGNAASLVQVDGSGSYIGGLVGVSQHYLCCDNLGPPYVLSVQGWRELAPRWGRMTADKSAGWGADQVAFAAAAREAGIRFNVFDHFMVSDHSVPGEAWPLVEKALEVPAGDVCSTKLFSEQPGGRQLPTFMHVVRPWTIGPEGSNDAWGFSKYQVPPGWHNPQTTDGILECGMPLFAEPPSDLLVKNGGSQRDGWAICTILHSLNTMLVKYKTASCPAGYNQARALKMKVPLQWTNELLEGAVEAAPEGTDIEWMKKCATLPSC